MTTLNYTQMAINALLNKLADSIPEIRAKAAEALGIFGDSNTTQTLINCLKTETDITVKLKLIEALGKMDNVQIEKYLINSLQDPDPVIRSTAAIALGELGLEDVITALANACSDQDNTVRLNAVEAIGKIGLRLFIKTKI